MESNNPPKQKSKVKKFFTWLIISVISILVLSYFICGLTYSTGSRSGIVIKLSQKGYIFKTYEGEINLGGISEGDGTLIPNKIWSFSVDKDNTEVYDAITKLEGKHVRLYYKQVYKAFFWRSETPYLIQKVETVN